MPQPVTTPPSSSDDDRRRRRRRLALVAGLALMLLGAPAMLTVAFLSGADWAFIAALVAFLAGLFTVGGIITPGRSSFQGGTKIWHNDGLPGGGAGGGA